MNQRDWTKMRQYFAVVLLGGIVCVSTNCRCNSGGPEHIPNSGWIDVACKQNVLDGKYYPVLLNHHPRGGTNDGKGTEIPTDSLPDDFFHSDYDCSNKNSPWKPKALAPAAYPAAQKNPFGSSRTRAASSFLGTTTLDLPFPAILDQSTPAKACSASSDILQVNHSNAKVIRFSTCPFRMVARIPVVSRPLEIEVTPDGTTALVTSFDNAVNFINLATNTVTYTLTTPGDINPDGIAITPDGSTAYITSFNTTNPIVAVIDLASKTIKTTIRVASYPQSAFMSPDGSQVYITFPLGSAVYIIDTLSNTVAATIAIPSTYGVAFNSTGTRAYITSATGTPNTVQEVDTATLEVRKTYPVGLTPVDITVRYGDDFVSVVNVDDGSTSLIHLGDGKVTTTKFGLMLRGLVQVQ